MNTEINAGKIYKATIYFTDSGGEYNTPNDFWDDFNALTDRMGSFNVFSKEECPIMWYDDIDINYRDAEQETYDKYFQVNKMTLAEIEKALGYKVEIVDDKKKGK